MMPTELSEYLRMMISPEHRVKDCQFLHVTNPANFDWAAVPDESVHALLVESDTVEAQEAWVWHAYRIVKPGAHVLLAAPDDERIGDTGACLAEDAGFEVRDCILWVDQPGDGDHLHYVAKAAAKEREAGLGHLPERAFAQSGGAQGALAESESEDGAIYGEDGDIGLNKISMRRNTHPTVKPKTVMERLLSTVPKDRGPVLDPFLGSGTTMIACATTGHDGIGIEREAEYLPIADARVRHWSLDASGWPRAEIVSDLEKLVGQQSESEPEVLDFFSFMDGE